MFLLFDIGATNTRIAVSENGTDLHTSSFIKTPVSFDEIIAEMKKVHNTSSTPITAVAGGIAAPLTPDKTMLANNSNLPKEWMEIDLVEKLQAGLGISAYLENDAALVGLGEALVGAGKGEKIVVYMTISTGVGGVRIVNGEVDASAFGFEPGHQIIDPNGPICPGCGGKGHIEAYASGKGIEARFGKPAAEITDEKIWDEIVRALSVGLTNTIVHWSPDVVVLGGSVMKSLPIEKVKMYVEKFLTIFPQKPEIVPAELEDSGGLYGALTLLQKKSSSFTSPLRT